MSHLRKNYPDRHARQREANMRDSAERRLAASGIADPAERARVWRSCARKSRYGSRRDAIGAARRRLSEGAGPLRPYRCPHCDGWHMTSNPRASQSQ